jgi:hypothetical protein
MNTLVNYATETFFPAQRFSSKMALKYGRFDRVRENNPSTLEHDFSVKYADILNEPRGAGYWLWKPYCIIKALEASSEGDIVMYTDSASHFIASAKPLFELPKKVKQDVIPFALEHKEAHYTKRDTFIALDCDYRGFEELPQRLASFILVRKSHQSLSFFNEYLMHCQNKQILNDAENTHGAPNYPGFKVHRHDQSIFSLLTKKHKLEVFRDPSQWGNPHINSFSNSPYPQLINHTRQSTPKQAKLHHRFFFSLKRSLKGGPKFISTL